MEQAPYWVHCNKCYSPYVKENFYFVNCGHILCKKCTSTSFKNKCCLLHTEIKQNKIFSFMNLPDAYKSLFDNTWIQDLEKSLKIREFQKKQQLDMLNTQKLQKELETSKKILEKLRNDSKKYEEGLKLAEAKLYQYGKLIRQSCMMEYRANMTISTISTSRTSFSNRSFESSFFTPNVTKSNVGFFDQNAPNMTLNRSFDNFLQGSNRLSTSMGSITPSFSFRTPLNMRRVEQSNGSQSAQKKPFFMY